MELQDAYFSVREALCHAALYHDRDINLLWVHSEDLEQDGSDALLRSVQGIIVPGGFGVRGIEGMVKAASYARINEIPYLGLCMGMQVMVIDFARYALGSTEPNSTEFDASTHYPVIDLLPEQKTIGNKGGTMRLGNYPCQLVKGSHAAAAYGQELVNERHRHRFEFNNQFRTQLQEAGLVYSGLSPDGRLVEICELANHPWMVSCQFHPEFGSHPGHPVIDLLPEQKAIKDKGGTMRLGNYPCQLVDGSRAAKAYDESLVQERHRHRFEFNNEFRDLLQKGGMIYSGLSPDGRLVELCELANHPWMVSCQFHPEFGSHPGHPHPLFRDFIGIAKDLLREGAQPSLPLSP
ncbi:CTP synthase [subsurface metagenome]